MMSSKQMTLRFLVAVVLCLIFCNYSSAQVSLGTISGLVTDQSGAAVPGARVSATNNQTNQTTSAVSNADGSFVMLSMRVGTYTVTASLTGFRTAVQTSVIVSTASTTTLSFVLVPGQVDQTVTVRGTAPLLQPTSPQLSTVVDQRDALDLPLELSGNTTGGSGRRQLDNFIFLTPGVTGNTFSKSFNGSPMFMQEILIDGGISSAATTTGFVGSYSPPMEAVQEFNVQNTAFLPEYGRGFSVMNFTLKSGTNQFHGDAFEFLRNDAFDARPFFSSSTPVIRQNEFGGTLGGPIILPKIYNGKDRTFFFLGYTGFRKAGGAPNAGYVTVPTVAMKNGDFTQLTPLGINIYDPATTRPDGHGGFVRDQFSCNGVLNVICPDRIDPAAKKLLSFLPDPDINQPFNNYLNRSYSPTVDNAFSIKVDHTISDSHRMEFSYWLDHTNIPGHGPISGPLDNGYNEYDPGAGLRLNLFSSLSSNLLNHFLFGYTSNTRSRTNFTNLGNSEVGIPNLTNIAGFPCFDFVDLPTLGSGCNSPWHAFNRTFQFADDLSWNRGKHQFKFGLDIHRYEQNGVNLGQAGDFGFSPLETSQPDSPNVGALGSDIASFLLGQVDTATQLIGTNLRGFRDRYYAGYAQDKYQLTHKLNLEIGLLVQHVTPVSEVYGRMSSLSLTTPNPGAGGLPGALIFAGSGTGRTGKDSFVDGVTEMAPRLGIAYAIGSSSVVRASYGIYYAPSNGNTITGSNGSQYLTGFSFNQSLTSSNNGVTPAMVLSVGFPAFTTPLPDFDPTLANGGSIDYFNQAGAHSATLQSWTFDVQRAFRRNILLDLAYVGQRATHLASNLENLNQVNPKYLSLGSLLEADINSPAARAANIPIPYAGFSGSVAQALRPFPQYTNINDLEQPTSVSSYHGLQLKLQKRFSDGLSFLVSYTMSKVLADSIQTPYQFFAPVVLDTYQRSLEKAIAPNDMTHNLVTSFIYELPIGPGKRFVNAHGAVGKIVGGWQVDGVLHYSSGVPLSITGGPSLPLFGGPNRPNLLPGVPIRTPVSAGSFDPAKDVYLNINAFSQPAPFTFGTVGPQLPNVRGFPNYNEDISLIKRTHITESQILEFRMETFNTFNRVVFSNPASNINNPSTFGKVFGQANSPRAVQFALKYLF